MAPSMRGPGEPGGQRVPVGSAPRRPDERRRLRALTTSRLVAVVAFVVVVVVVVVVVMMMMMMMMMAYGVGGPGGPRLGAGHMHGRGSPVRSHSSTMAAPQSTTSTTATTMTTAIPATTTTTGPGSLPQLLALAKLGRGYLTGQAHRDIWTTLGSVETRPLGTDDRCL